MNCERCHKKIPQERLKVLPDTRLCVKCSSAVGGDYEIEIVEENEGNTIISKPIIHKTRRVIEEL